MKRSYGLHLTIIIWFFVVLLIASAFGVFLTNFLVVRGILPQSENGFFIGMTLRLVFTMLFTILIGLVAILISAKYILKPFSLLSHGLKQVAAGDFTQQLEPMGDREMRALINNFNLMTRELNSTSTLNQDFMSNIAHEFKTPISSIKGFNDLLMQTTLTPEQEEYTGIISQEISRLSRLSSNILQLTKLENQEIAANNSVFSIDEQVRRCLLLLQSAWTSKNITLDVQLDKVDYLGNRELFQMVWLNLMDNAVKFTENNGTICITLTTTNTGFTFTIKDNGIGMLPDTLTHIFHRFYQGDPGASTESSGLGLPLVHKIVSLYQGKITAESAIGQGSSFTVVMP